MDKEKILELADLSKIDLVFDDFDAFARKLSDVENYINMLDKLDLTGVEPTIWAEKSPTRLREDVPVPGLSKDEILANAPEKLYGYFEIKKVIE